MTIINANTKKGQNIIRELGSARIRDIFQAYARPSTAKIRSFNAIKERANETEGYNGDLAITGANSNFYSTIYSVTDLDGVTTIIKDTYADTYAVVVK